MKFVSLKLIITLVYVSANQEDVTKKDTNFDELKLGIRTFSKVFMKHIRETQIGNYVVSPLSLHLALGIISSGAGGSTSYELHRALGTIQIKNDLLEAYKVLSEKLWTVYSKLQVHHKIWLSNNFIPNPEFVTRLKNWFLKAEIGVLTAEVNKWASQIFSGGGIDNLKKLGLSFLSGEISRNNSFIISSVLDFNEVLLNRLKVTYRKFYINDILSKDVPMIHINGPVIYGQLPEIRASFIKYDFTGTDLSMIIIRSNVITDFIKLEEQLENINISTIHERGNLVNMSFFLPKFKLQNTLELKEIVQKMGIIQIFETSANFTGISGQGLKVDRIIQKISVDINENGAAVNSSSDIRYSKRISRQDESFETESFDINTPFHFAVLHERTKLPLIRGRIINPIST